MVSAWMLLPGGTLLMVAAWWFWRRASSQTGRSRRTDESLQTAPSGPVVLRHYSPKNVGNDASARPWESALGTGAASGKPDAPEGFDREAFLLASKTNFVSLQAAWDRGDIPALRAMLTDGMLEQIQAKLVEREKDGGARSAETEVVMIEARLLGVEAQGDGHAASVEFSGLLQEVGSAGPSPFREVWSITRSPEGAGSWLVAGVQALQ